MYTKLGIVFVVAIHVSACLANQHFDFQPLLAQQNLVMRQMMNQIGQSGAKSIGVDNIVTCFAWYTSQQNKITTTYNTDLNQCVSAAAEAKMLLSAQSAEERSNLEGRGHSICTQLTECEAVDDALDFFTCYKNAGSANSQIFYNISAGSESVLNNIAVSYQHVDDTERTCTANARNTYVTSLSASATNLNNCLVGAWVPPTSTDAPEAETTESQEPETTETPEAETTEDAGAEETTEDAGAEETTESDDTTEKTETTKEEEEVTDQSVEYEAKDISSALW